MRGLFCLCLLLTLAVEAVAAVPAPRLVEASKLKETSVTYNRKKYRVFCLRSIPGSARVSGALFRFTPFAYTRSRISQRLAPAKYALYSALITQGTKACKRILSSPAPSPTPTPTGNFDVNGNVTEAGRVLFGIPQGLAGNISTGRTVFNTYCVGCHAEKTGRSFPYVRGAIKNSPMLYDESDLPDSQLAHLIAFLNRFRP